MPGGRSYSRIDWGKAIAALQKFKTPAKYIGKRLLQKYLHSYGTGTKSKPKRAKRKHYMPMGGRINRGGRRYRGRRAGIAQKMLRAIGQNHVYRISAPTQISSSVGQQGISTMSTSLDITQLNLLFSQCVTDTKTTTVDTDKYYLQSIKQEHTYVNTSVGTTVLTIYDVVCKEHTADSEHDTPSACWAAGSLDETITGGTQMSTQVFASPRQSDLFNLYYSIRGRKQVVLQPGEIFHYHTFRTINRWIKKSEVQYFASYNSKRGITQHQMAVAMGQIGHDSGTAGALGFSYAPVVVGCISNTTIRFCSSDDSIKTSLVSTTVPTSTVGTFKVVSEIAGDVKTADTTTDAHA